MKRALILGVALLMVVLSVSGAMAFGGPMWNNQRSTQVATTDPVELTEEQQAELDAVYEKMWDLRVELINKQVELGLIDAEDAQYFIERMELAKKYDRTGFGPGVANQNGFNCPMGGYGHGRGGRGSRGQGMGMMGW